MARWSVRGALKTATAADRLPHAPDAVVARLNQEIVPFLKRADVRDKFFAAGMEPLGSAPEALAATVKSEMNRLGKVIKAAGIAIEP